MASQTNPIDWGPIFACANKWQPLNEIRKRNFTTHKSSPTTLYTFYVIRLRKQPLPPHSAIDPALLALAPPPLVWQCGDRRSFWNVHHHYDDESRKGQMKKGCHFRWKMRIDHTMAEAGMGPDALKRVCGRTPNQKMLSGVPNGRGKLEKNAKAPRITLRRHPLVTGQQEKNFTANTRAIHRNEMKNYSHTSDPKKKPRPGSKGFFQNLLSPNFVFVSWYD